MEYKIPLRRIEMAQDIFEELLLKNSYWVEEVNNIGEYYCGNYNNVSRNRLILINPEHDEIVIRESRIKSVKKSYSTAGSFVQVIIKMNPRLKDGEILSDLTGRRAYFKLYRMLKKFYSEEEIEAIYDHFKADFDDQKKQFHYDIDVNPFIIYKFNDCYKYDINGAHCDALVEMFPLAKDMLIKTYNRRKTNPQYKSLINYFVGYLCRMNHRETYNWIVQRTTKILAEAMEKVGGRLIYANTDGFAITKPIISLNVSKELGEFKEEYKGPVYVYKDKNYLLYKFGDEYKGSSLKSVRNLFDLEHGTIVQYDRILNESAKIYEAKNIKLVNGVKIYEK